MPSTPSRSCVACRKQAARDTLLRFVISGENILCFDGRKVMSGRGAWLCRDVNCLRKAIDKRAFHRSFKRALKVPPEQTLLEQINLTFGGVMDG